MMAFPFPRMTPARRFFAASLLALVVGVTTISVVQAQVPEAAPVTEASEAAGHESAAHESAEHEAGWMPTIAKVVNFAALVGILGYFLRAPLTHYLVDRHGAIRRDLSEAQAVRASAEAQLAAVRARLSELPAELAALEARGRTELAEERERMKAATAAEREKLLDRTRREIDLQFRVARRDLLEHTADLAMSRAKARIAQTITPDDQARLVARYAAEVHS
jgi:F0F1-type ATP synthase membrane subunit b/b'